MVLNFIINNAIAYLSFAILFVLLTGVGTYISAKRKPVPIRSWAWRRQEPERRSNGLNAAIVSRIYWWSWRVAFALHQAEVYYRHRRVPSVREYAED